jgi:hypothetical protein
MLFHCHADQMLHSIAQGSMALGGRVWDDSGGQLALASGILEHSNFIPMPDQNCAAAQSPTHLFQTTNFGPSEHHTQLPVPQPSLFLATASQQPLHPQWLMVNLTDVIYE